MAGHSKWANIKHRKDKADKLKGKLFSRLAKEIISSVKMGGADQATNPRLRLAIQKAKAANFPNDNIERNIKKAGTSEGNFDVVTYEIYGFGGVGIYVEASTDNKNRMATDIRIATNKRGGTITTPGAVAFNFEKKGVIAFKKGDPNALLEASLEAGAEDFEVSDDGYIVLTDPQALYSVKEKLDKLGFVSEEASIEMFPKSFVACDEENKKSNLALIEWLEDLDDVDAVYHNMELE